MSCCNYCCIRGPTGPVGPTGPSGVQVSAGVSGLFLTAYTSNDVLLFPETTVIPITGELFQSPVEGPRISGNTILVSSPATYLISVNGNFIPLDGENAATLSIIATTGSAETTLATVAMPYNIVSFTAALPVVAGITAICFGINTGGTTLSLPTQILYSVMELGNQ